MKPGDKVWYFEHITERITESEVVRVCRVGDHKVLEVKDPLHAVAPFALWPVRNVSAERAFPTREALCEHYRKLFE